MCWREIVDENYFWLRKKKKMENKINNNNLVECCRVATLRSRLSFGLTLACGVWDDRIILKNGKKEKKRKRKYLTLAAFGNFTF